MASSDAEQNLITALDSARRQFLALVEPIRPDLHRYCARMTGAVADGEDVVQQVLARAYYELSQLQQMPALRPWLFRMAHNACIDHWRHESHRRTEALDAALDIADEPAHEPDSQLARAQAVRLAMSRFLELAPAQRGCVILKDVLDHTLNEIAEELGLSVPAVKAALHRGRETLQRLGATPPTTPREHEISPALRRYATLFSSHDWDGIRALLAEDIRLDLVSQRKAAGRREVGAYFGNYERAGAWRVAPAWLDGREVLGVWRTGGPGRPDYFVELRWRGEQLCEIRDFRYVPYIAQEAGFELAG